MSNGVQERQPTGWTVFAGMLLVIVGSLDALWGLAGILNDQVVVVGGHGTIVADVTTWGWVHLILGSIVALTGMALFTGNTTARCGGGCLRDHQRDLADRLLPTRTAVGVPDDHPRRHDHLPADRALGPTRAHETVVNAAATANPSVVTRPAVRPASLVASGIIESISITISAPAAKPSIIALKSPDVAFATA